MIRERITEYGFCSSVIGVQDEMASLRFDVNRVIGANEGWEPIGGVTTMLTKSGPMLIQAMVRYEWVER